MNRSPQLSIDHKRTEKVVIQQVTSRTHAVHQLRKTAADITQQTDPVQPYPDLTRTVFKELVGDVLQLRADDDTWEPEGVPD